MKNQPTAVSSLFGKDVNVLLFSFPVPLVHLCEGQIDRMGELCTHLFSPIRVLGVHVFERLNLVGSQPLPLFCDFALSEAFTL